MRRFSGNPIIALLFTLYHLPQNIYRLCVSAEYRSVFCAKLFRAKDIQQATTLTYMNRYPEVFSDCRDYFGHRKNIRILSFGCSTGDEVLTLRKYFPDAEIIGAEINKYNLKKCRELPLDKNITFIYSKNSTLQQYGPYDAIFCMAVLQRIPTQIRMHGITNIKKLYPFDKFNKQLMDLDKLVRMNGLLVVHFTQYMFSDSDIAYQYEPLDDQQQSADLQMTIFFDKQGQIIKSPAQRNSIFIKKIDNQSKKHCSAKDEKDGLPFSTI